MKIAVVIPARYASSRFPGKPLYLIDGKPLILHVVSKVSKCKNIDFVTVATDDKRIYDVVKKAGFNVKTVFISIPLRFPNTVFQKHAKIILIHTIRYPDFVN